MAKFFIFPFATAGDKTAIPDDTQPSGAVSYETGFGPDYQKDLATDPDAKPIPRPESNQLYFDITDAIRQYQTLGVPDFITTADNGGVPFPYDIYARVRYDDGGGFQIYESMEDTNTNLPSDVASWRVISNNAGGVVTGTIIDFGGTVAPTGYLPCDGAAVSRTTYAALFGAIGTTWGVGDGSTTFNVPDFRRRTAIGSGGTGTGIIGNAVGDIGGAETYALTISNMPSHSHPGSAVQVRTTGPIGAPANSVTSSDVVTGPASAPLSIAPEGGGVAHTIMQPSAVTLKCIKI